MDMNCNGVEERVMRSTHIAQARLRLSSVSILALLIAVCFLVLVPADAKAASYDFEVNAEHIQVHILKDGSIDIDYQMDFTNWGALDGVDIGLPNRHYDEGSANANISACGKTWNLNDYLRRSPYVEVGMAVDFPSYVRSFTDQPGTRFTLRFHVNNPHMVYLDEVKSGYAGILFRPTWFDPAYQRGDTDVLDVKVYLPKGMANASQAVYLKDHPWANISFDFDSYCLIATWGASDVDPGDQEGGKFDVGVGFPKMYVERYYEHDLRESLEDLYYSSKTLFWLFCPFAVIALVITLFIITIKVCRGKARKDYFEPKLTQVGAGPRRDLTAVEAAVVLDRPLEMVVTMILYGLIRKGTVQVISRDKPIRLRKTSDTGTYSYEVDYLAAIKDDGTLNKDLLRLALVTLIQNTEKKMAGFDLEDTKEYYVDICSRAWDEVRNAQTPEESLNKFEQSHDWVMLDLDYENTVDTVFSDPKYHNRALDKKYGDLTPMRPTGERPRDTLNIPYTPRDWAKDYVKDLKSASRDFNVNLKSVAKDVVRSITPHETAKTWLSKMDFEGAGHDVLSTGRTVHRTLGGFSGHSSGGHGGGHGGGCACACACACAGGGR